MRKTLLTIALSGLFFGAIAQPQQVKHPDFVFTDVKVLKATPVKNQANSGTCWCYSGLSAIESELIRSGKGEFDLSEMFIVRHAYAEKVKKYIRMHGDNGLSQGGAFCDVLEMSRKYGIVPEEAYRGLEYGTTLNNHGEVERILKAFGDAVIKNKTLTTAWEKALDGILDAYFGKLPEKFTYNGKEYTPQSFASYLGFNADDYVSITSFTHHPFYSQFAIEVPDNWLWGLSYNLPLDEFAKVFDYAINNGHTIAWASDVSERGFTRNFAYAPQESTGATVGTDQAKWTGEQAKTETVTLPKEMEVTQEMRQQWFDDYRTTDDHGMEITGIAKDQDGNKFYKVKNSWGEGGQYAGYLYVSEPFVKAKTLNIVVHKKAIPADLAKKLGIKQ